MDSFWGYLIGGIIGGMIGVAIDRAYQAFENRVRLEVSIAHIQIVDVQLSIGIINRGTALPPARLELLIDHLNHSVTSYGFTPHERNEEGIWFPHQHMTFYNVLCMNGRALPMLKMYTEHKRPFRAELRLYVANSSKAIWVSEEMGESVLAHLCGAYEQNQFPKGLPHRRTLKYDAWLNTN